MSAIPNEMKIRDGPTVMCVVGKTYLAIRFGVKDIEQLIFRIKFNPFCCPFCFMCKVGLG